MKRLNPKPLPQIPPLHHHQSRRIRPLSEIQTSTKHFEHNENFPLFRHYLPVEPLLDEVLKAAFEVQNTLGAGFLENVYERALMRELTLRRIKAEAQPKLDIQYKGEQVGHYQPDILVQNELLVELKCADQLIGDHTAQCLNYLKAANKTTCLLLNFQKPRVELSSII